MSWSVDHGSPGPGPDLPENLDDILVFGYGCKLFRDDEKAEWIEKEEHLIPWMGDVSLKIDRYDGRGALMDLKPFVPPLEGHLPEESLNPEETELEKLLEEERYKDLREDSEYDDLDYQEVEFRKFQSDVNGVVGHGQYAAIGYSYDEVVDSTTTVYPEPNKKIDEDLPYTKPAGLTIPDDIVLPATIKLHAIIEKTAKFIAGHGNQMEIILKTKQSGNPLFNFLGYTDSLNPYYKFLVQAIRCNSYKPAEEVPEPDIKTASHEECSGSEDESSYLHPSLFRSSTDPSPAISKITYKHPGGPTAYSMLVSKIKGSNPEPPPTSTNSSDPYNYYYPHSQDSSYPPGWSDPTGLCDPNANKSLDPSATPMMRPQSQVPAQQDQLVIEKMASYVVKNGSAFEELARTKGDPRFVFLHPAHEYHWYYLNCKERFKAETSAVVASGNFVSYSEPSSTATTSSSTSSLTPATKTIKSLEIRRITSPQKVPIITLQSISLPLSASGIPIANHASISSRPATIPPEVASRIEEIKKKNSLFAKKEKEQQNSLDLSPQKKDKAKIQFSSSICRNMSLGTETVPASEDENPSSDEIVMPKDVETGSTENIPSQNIELLTKFDPDETATEVLICLDNGSQAQIVLEEEGPKEDVEEKERKRKEERRRKAALFLQRIQLKTQKPTVLKSTTEAVCSNNNELEKNGVDEDVLSEVESIPDPGGQNIREELKENDIRASDKARERLWDDSKIEIRETTRISKNGSCSRSSSLHAGRSRSQSRGRSTSRKRSLSESSESSEDSSKSKRKRAKQKHSKKRKKKREKDRSSSRTRSKKSKRHKH